PALVSTINPPAAAPSTRGGRKRTSHAASGAAITPPISRPSTMVKFTPDPVRAKKKLMLADSATMNSDALTDPITLRGCSRPLDNSVDVAIGPQPPPPAASTNPATRPSGARNFAPG